MAKKILVTAFFIETLCVTYFLSFDWLVPIATVLYFITGIAIALSLLFLPQSRIKFPKLGSFVRTFNGYKLIALGMMGVVMCHLGYRFMDDAPLNYHDSDMLPIIKVMSQRFLQGNAKHVYDTIPEIWNGIKPIYLPAMWLPFSVAEKLHIDIRWVTILALFFAFTAGILMWNPFKHKKLSLPFTIAAFMLFWWLFANDSSGLVPYTEEGVVIINYVWLAIALLSGNYVFIGVAASLCALSRYALVGWLPAMLILLYVQGKTKQWIHLKISGIICFVLLVLWPFGWELVGNVLKLPSAYIDFAGRVWKDGPQVFATSLGFAKFFGPSRIALQHNLLIILSFSIPTIFVLVCSWVNYKNKATLNNIALAALKISLVIFYCFIDVPYLYLFYTSSFVSFILVAYWLSIGEEQVAVVPILEDKS